MNHHRFFWKVGVPYKRHFFGHKSKHLDSYCKLKELWKIDNNYEKYIEMYINWRVGVADANCYIVMSGNALKILLINIATFKFSMIYYFSVCSICEECSSIYVK
jgi:hypothetical protein